MSNEEQPYDYSFRPAPKSKPRRWYGHWWGKILIGVFGIFLSLVVALGFYVFQLADMIRSGELSPTAIVPRADNTPNIAKQLVDENDPFLGVADADVVIVEFSDFQCPFCSQMYPVVKQLLKDYGTKIKFVYKDFPLVDIHPEALIAAMAGACAHEQGSFWAMHDKIFENQTDLSEAALKRYAIQAGLNSLAFSGCMQSGELLNEIQEDLNTGVAAGVTATPTFFINSQKIDGAVNLASIEAVVVSELSKYSSQ